MALLFLNPADSKYNWCWKSMVAMLNAIKYCFTAALQRIISPIASLQQTAVRAYLFLIDDDIHEKRCNLMVRKLHMKVQWARLTWQWWQALIFGIWYAPPHPESGRTFNGTYWMHVNEDLYQLQKQFKQLRRERRRLDKDKGPDPYWERFRIMALHLSMFLLNLVGILDFAAKIIRFKLFPPDRRRKTNQSKCASSRSPSDFHVHSTVLNLDNRIQTGNDAISFDTDSKTVVCNNSANVHICNDENMFVGKVIPTKMNCVATTGGEKSKAKETGIVRWKWKDDDGLLYSIDLKDVLYFPTSPVNILSVTSLAAQLNDKTGTGINTRWTTSTFYWENNKFQRTIPHSASNLPELPINEGFTLASLYTKAVGLKVNLTKSFFHCHRTTLISQDETDDELIQPTPKLNLSDDIFHVGETLLYTKEGQASYVRVEKIFLDSDSILKLCVRSASDQVIETTIEFLRAPELPDIGWIPTSIPEKRTAAANLPATDLEKLTNPVKLSPLQEDFLAFHERLWHLPFKVMFRMVKLGLLPNKFKKLKNKAPPCVSCLFGHAHRRPWQFKKTKDGMSSMLRMDSKPAPGQTVGIDQLTLAQPGLVPQAKGFATRARIWAATVFIDYATSFMYVSLMDQQSGEATLQAKHNFENLAASQDVDIKSYHADNGRFAERAFLDDAKKSHQRVTFCSVGAHHQNGITENAIKQLTLSARTLLVHAQTFWPEYISTMLWPFALKAAQDRHNQLNIDLQGKSPDMKFSGVAASTFRFRDFHTFGCPCYILDSRLQSSTIGVPNWEPRARLGIYLGRSPAHASNVALVLNPKTGLVSPQFHVVFDDDFTTVPHLRKGTVPENWAKLVAGSTEKTTSEFVDLTKTWLDPTPDESAGELLTSNEDSISNEGGPSSNEGASTFQNMRPTTNSILNEGDTMNSTSNEGDNRVNYQHGIQANEGENVQEQLFMPKMINLESAGLRRSSRLASQTSTTICNFYKTMRLCITCSNSTTNCSILSRGQASRNDIFSSSGINQCSYSSMQCCQC